MRPEAVFGLDRQRDLEMIRRVRDVIGDELELIVDTPGHHRIWDVPTAIQRFRDLEPYRLKWIEQPLAPHDLEAYAQLRAAVMTPIGTGEDEWNVESYKRLIQSGGVDIVQIDPGRCHGLTGSRHVIKLIEAENLLFSAHSWSSALNTAASLHMLASSTHADCTDFKPTNPRCSMNWSVIRGYKRTVMWLSGTPQGWESRCEKMLWKNICLDRKSAAFELRTSRCRYEKHRLQPSAVARV